jgi:hypothetical protein
MVRISRSRGLRASATALPLSFVPLLLLFPLRDPFVLRSESAARSVRVCPTRTGACNGHRPFGFAGPLRSAFTHREVEVGYAATCRIDGVEIGEAALGLYADSRSASRAAICAKSSSVRSRSSTYRPSHLRAAAWNLGDSSCA